MFPQKQKHIKFHIPEQLLFVPFTEVLHFPLHSHESERQNFGTLSKLIDLIKKASLVEYVDKKISQFLFMRARDKNPALSKILNFPDDR